MAGIYLHIPFCKTRCIYCDFYTGVNESRIDDFVDVLCLEAKQRKDEIGNTPVNTIYFGGGTPSRLGQEYFEQIFDVLYSSYNISPETEITLEANPDDLSESYIQTLRNLPFNRLSIGIQSFNNDELRFLSRRHSAEQAIRAVEQSKEIGISNISIDLMYGIPNQTEEIWLSNVEQALKLDIPHISAYHLIYEERTKLFSLRKAGRVKPVHEDVSNAMFQILIKKLVSEGFEHYEISNFGRPGFISLHNSSYWKGEDYLGFGPSAHSYSNQIRSWNISSLNKYIQGVNSNNMAEYRESEELSNEEKYNEFVFTGLRTMWGIDLNVLRNKFGINLYHYALSNAQKHINSGFLSFEKQTLKLTPKGIFISDGIMSDLMWV